MSKTIRLSDVTADPEGAVKRAKEHAVQQARFMVIRAKRSMAKGGIAYVDSRVVDAGGDSRSDLKVKA